MKKLIIFIIGFLLSIVNLPAQEVKICVQTGCGFYNMGTMSSVTNDLLHQLPFEAKILSNYPPYYYYQPMIKLSFKNFDFGFVYTFQTTGSVISSKDYSGEYRLDSKINGYSPGIILSSIINDYESFKVGLFLQSGMNFSKLKMNEYLQVDTMVNRSNIKFRANSFYFEPGMYLAYTKNNISFELNIGYFKEIRIGDYEMEKGSGRIVVKKNFYDSDVWDGFRLGVTFSYTLFKKTEDKTLKTQ